jgi:hypothetical protein
MDEFIKALEKNKEYDLIEVWHYLMLSYGYIPWDDFLNMDAGSKDKLVLLLNQMHIEEQKAIDRAKRGKK